MSKQRKYRYFMGDFETTVFEGQEFTEVWASAFVELFTDEVIIHHSIRDTFEYLKKLKDSVVIYYHNLKFDGTFWLSFLMNDLKFEQAKEQIGEEEYEIEFVKERYMKNNTFQYSISDMGQWYTIRIKVNDKIIEIRDSLKLLPFSVKKIGNSFGTAHKKLDMEYTGFRYAGCNITPEEEEYIKNDVLVVKEALEIMFKQGHDKLTIGSCCMKEFKTNFSRKVYDSLFPNLYEYVFDNPDQYGSPSIGEYIRKSYHGGWCYVVKGKENKIYHNGLTLDVNSLYPSMMSDQSGNEYPFGLPEFWSGNYIPDEALEPHRYFFIRIKTRFYIKPGKLPTVQIKGNLLYRGTEWLETSDVVNYKTGHHSHFYIDYDGSEANTRVTMTMTQTDYKLFIEHYNVTEFEILDGCYFSAKPHLFEDYIEKYKRIKMESKGAIRELAKLFLNNLYGKLAASTDSSFKYAYLKEDGSLGFVCIDANDKKPGYIPCGSAITSYARNFTIRAAQKNFYGKDKPGFIYADTDSLHMDISPDQLKDIPIHSTEFCHWKLETQWDTGLFVRQKTYIEHAIKDGYEDCEPHYIIRCAGMPEHCKDLFQYSMDGWDFSNLTEEQKKIYEKLDEDEKEFIHTKRSIDDFKVGLVVPGKLIPKQIKGGTLLVKTEYTMRERGF